MPPEPSTEEKPCAVHDSRISRLETDTVEQWTAINQLRNRLPGWATAVISLLTFLLGCSVTYAGLVLRMVGK